MKPKSAQKRIECDKKLPSGDMFMPDMTKEAMENVMWKTPIHTVHVI